MTHLYNLVVGDWSLDGHNKRKNFVLMTSLSQEEIERCYEEGTKLLGYDMTKNLCCKYEDVQLTSEAYDAFVAQGYDFHCDSKEQATDLYYFSIFDEDFIELYLFVLGKGAEILGLGDISLFKIQEPEHNFNIGGYGLYS